MVALICTLHLMRLNIVSCACWLREYLSDALLKSFAHFNYCALILMSLRVSLNILDRVLFFRILNYIYLFYTHVGAEGLNMCRNGCMRLEDNFQEPVFSFHHADFWTNLGC